MRTLIPAAGRMALATVLLSSCAAVAQSVSLVKDGRSEHRIVLGTNASPSETFAAEELQTHVKACTGVELPIVVGTPTGDEPIIAVGFGEATADANKMDKMLELLGEQGFVLRTSGQNVVIAGGPQAGTLYGVYEFLEDYLGVRWYQKDVTVTPKTKNVTFPAIHRVEKPAFKIRDVSYRMLRRDPVHYVRMRLNRNGQLKDHPQGKGFSFRGTCHSYFSYVRPGEFFDEHPEYFSEIGGERFRAETQLCLTNPDLLDIVTQRMLERMKADPHHDQYNFSQMDYYNYCECDKCTAVNKKYGTLGGTQFWFVNKLAERTSKVYPDKLIGTLAYMYTEEPPKGMTMHENVAVWLCHMFPSCDSHPVRTCPLNADYKRRALAWSKICKHLYIWHYIVDFAHYYNPFPNFRAFADDLKLYKELGVESIYLQAMGHSGGGGEFSHLRGYLAAKLAWNPDEDLDALIRDFVHGYYGPAGEYIHEYITMLHDKVEDENIHMHLYTNPAQGYLPDEVLERAFRLFDKAEQAVKGDNDLLQRVRIAAMPLTYAHLFPRNGYKVGGGWLEWLGSMGTQRDAIRFVQRMRKHGFKTIREWGGDPEQMLMLAGMFNSRLRVETLKNDHLTVEVVPNLGGRALRIIHNATGECVTAYNNKRVLFFPFCGGVEARVGETFRFFGWMEPATIAHRGDNVITVTQETMDGSQLRKTFQLVEGKPQLKVAMTVTNPREKPAEVRLRSHLELDLGALAQTRVRFTSLSGKRVDKGMAKIIEGLREGEHYDDREAPNGSWTLSGTKGLSVTQSWDPGVVDYAWLYAYPDYLGQLDNEIWLKRKVLGPKESLTFHQTIEVAPTQK